MGLKAFFFIIVVALLIVACKPVVVDEPGVECDPNDKLCFPPSGEEPIFEEPEFPGFEPIEPEEPELPEPEVPEPEPETPEPEVPEVGLPRIVITEGGLVSLADIRATDPDNDVLTYSYTEPLDSGGEWQTSEGDAGEYLVTITASDGKTVASQSVLIIVKALNAAPMITGVADLQVDEGQTISLSPVATDPDGDDVTISYSGWMTRSTYTTKYDDAGTYFVTISATDGKTESSKQVKITVNNVNRKPVLGDISDISVTEGTLVTVKPVAIDQDGDAVTYTFEEPLDENGQWQTGEGDAGTYMVTVTASDSISTDTESLKIIVSPLNAAPVIQPIQEINVTAGETVQIYPQVTDPDGDDVAVVISGWMTSNTYRTTTDDGGEHTVVITASDGKATTSIQVKVAVNRPPVFRI
ncbi:MAG: PKD domain-containing protein [Nanoarchaeota archaeon]|nr:PKD domain-containing protein [Nanoarchaeota archaeon]